MSSDDDSVGGRSGRFPAANQPEQRSPEFHRKAVTSAILQAGADRRGRCVILGAGLCQDLHLPALLARFDELHLVDLDGESLERGASNQGVSAEPRLKLHAGVDLTGVHQAIEAAGRIIAAEHGPLGSDARHRLRSIQEAARHWDWPDWGLCDVVASTFVFSQIVQHVVDHLARYPQEWWIELVQTLRLRHLEMIADHCRPGGAGLFFTDVVSSESLPELTTCHPDELPTLLHSAVAVGNSFHGLNPAVIESLFQTQQSLRQRMTALRVSRPWIWNAGPRLYASLCFHLQK